MDDEAKYSLMKQLNVVFSPAAPIMSDDLFFGRIDQLAGVVEAVNERGQHVVLFGERGVGKTSLANIIDSRLRGILTAKVTCNRTETFKDIWTKILKRISFIQKSSGIGFKAQETEKKQQLDLFLPEGHKIDSSDILAVLQYVTNPVLLIFDEFDSIKTRDTLVRFTDTIKALSDNAPHITLLIVGIADSVNDLIGEHLSIERCIMQIRLPRMSDPELGQIIDNGLKTIRMTVDPYVRKRIIQFSQGFPHYTHLLAKYSARATIQSNATKIEEEHFDFAVADAVDNVQESVRRTYQTAIMTTKAQSKFEDVVWACALVEQDEHGTFRATDLERVFSDVLKRPTKLQAYIYHLGKLCQEDRGSILQKIGTEKQHRYRFRNPLLKAFIHLKLYQSGTLKIDNKSTKA